MIMRFDYNLREREIAYIWDIIDHTMFFWYDVEQLQGERRSVETL